MEEAYQYDKNSNPTQTIEWLEYRFFLFDKFCYPSLTNQSNKNFIWLVLFSQETPSVFKERIKYYEISFPLLKAIYFSKSDYGNLKSKLKDEILNYIKPNDEYVITSRIDNDDCFHKDMISDIQTLFNKQTDLFINFNWGLQYDLERNILTEMKYLNNHFITKIERISEGIQTVINYNHAAINDFDTKIKYIDNKKKPLWVEVIHSGNISNQLHPDAVPIFISKTLYIFGFTAGISLSETLSAFYRNRKRVIIIKTGAILRKIGAYNTIRSIYRYISSTLN